MSFYRTPATVVIRADSFEEVRRLIKRNRRVKQLTTQLELDLGKHKEAFTKLLGKVKKTLSKAQKSLNDLTENPPELDEELSGFDLGGELDRRLTELKECSFIDKNGLHNFEDGDAVELKVVIDCSEHPGLNRLTYFVLNSYDPVTDTLEGWRTGEDDRYDPMVAPDEGYIYTIRIALKNQVGPQQVDIEVISAKSS